MAEKDLVRLDRKLASSIVKLKRNDDYYEGEQPLKYMAPALEKEVGDRIAQLVINWPRLVADAFEARLDIEGFRYRGSESSDEELWNVWQANDLDEQSQQAHLDSIALSRSYVVVGSGDDDGDPPLVTVESPFQVFAERDPRTRKVSAAIKRWADEDPDVPVQYATLYLPDVTESFVWEPKRKLWVSYSKDPHELGKVPVHPLVNRPRVLRPDGLSEFHDVLPIADAANKMATDMMVSAEFHAMPRRWAFGLKESDFVDESGRPVSTWSMIAGRLWANESKDVSVGQFPEADLTVFHNSIKLLAQLASQMAALPPHYMSFTSDNPASADAINGTEAQLVKKAERKQTYLGGGWEDAQRTVLRIMKGKWDVEARTLETMWRDPSTPTISSKADAVTKLASGDRPIVPVEQAREDLGYSPEQRKRMLEMDDRARSNPDIERLTRSVNGE